MPGIASDRRRERSCAGAVETTSHMDPVDENPILFRRYSTPDPSSSIHGQNLPFFQGTDYSNLKDSNLKPSGSNLKDTNLKPPDSNFKDTYLKPPDSNFKDTYLKPPDSNFKDTNLKLPDSNFKDTNLKPPDSNLKDTYLKPPDSNFKDTNLKPPDSNFKDTNLKPPDSNFKDTDVRSPDSNLKDTNLKPPAKRPQKPIVPHLLLTPATLNNGRPLAPGDLTTSPQAISPQQTTSFYPPSTPPLSPVPIPRPPPPSTVWQRIQLTLFPSLTGFHQKSPFAKLVALVVCPAIFMMTLTLPVVDDEDLGSLIEEKQQQQQNTPIQSHHIDPPTIMVDDHDLVIEDQPEIVVKEQRWNRALTSFQCLLSPLFIAAVVTGGEESLQMILYAFLTGVSLSFLCYCSTNDECPPPFYTGLCYVGFAVAMLWIYLVANEVVGLLQAIGLIMGLSDAILGLTIFAMGSSLGDLVANVTIAKMGFPMMAMSACFGGPMLNILLGIGMGGMYMTLKTQEPYPITISPTLFLSSLGLLITLLSTFVYIPRNDYRMTKGWGHYLIVVYFTCMIANISLEVASGRS